MLTRQRLVSRTERHGAAAFQGWVSGDSPALVIKRRRSDDEVTRLLDRIRKLVAEQRRLNGGPGAGREAVTREIARLQLRLAGVVKSRLTR